MIGLLRAELRKTLSTRAWWALAIPVAMLSLLYNLFGALLAGLDGVDAEWPTLAPLLSLAFTLVLTPVFGAVAGIVGAAGEFRHHTMATTYLLTPSRGRVLLAKLAVGGLFGAVYVLIAVLVGVPAGMLGIGELPSPGLLLELIGLGMVIGGLWAAIGVAVGTAVGNQVGALVGTLIYLLFADRVFAILLSSADSVALAGLSAYLPGRAADIVIYDFLARGLAGPGFGTRVVEQIAAVTDPPPWWGALLVLLTWTAAAGGLGWLLNGRRDIG